MYNLQAIKNWTVGRPGNKATLSNSYMMGIVLIYFGDAQLQLFGGFKPYLISEVSASCNFVLLIRMPKPNSKCSSLSSVAEFSYMEGLFLFASRSCTL